MIVAALFALVLEHRPDVTSDQFIEVGVAVCAHMEELRGADALADAPTFVQEFLREYDARYNRYALN